MAVQLITSNNYPWLIIRGAMSYSNLVQHSAKPQQKGLLTTGTAVPKKFFPTILTPKNQPKLPKKPQKSFKKTQNL